MDKYHSFREKLKKSAEWPADYVFKFILKSAEKDKQQHLRSLFKKNVSLAFKSSSKGKYISVTIKALMESPNEIISIYENAGEIEGLIAL
jgi:hypothetical protein